MNKVRHGLKKVLALVLALAMCFSVGAIAASASPAVKHKYPVVLVSGLSGYSPDSKLCKIAGDYWGGIAVGSMAEWLTKNGVEAYETSVGPFSSNWDRACELYANIKGGRVDYGAAHSKKVGHERYGRVFNGVYPEWDADHPIDVIAHSMGAPTSIIFTSLLAYGDKDEQAASPNDCSELFKGGHSKWVNSDTTVCGTNNGTTLADGILNLITKLTGDRAKTDEIASGLCGVLGIALQGTDLAGLVADPMYDQWGFAPKAGESNFDYIKRCLDSNIWKSHDVCWFDMSTEYSRDIHRNHPENPDAYYFAIAAKASTDKSSTDKKQKHSDNLFILAPLYLALGNLPTDTVWASKEDFNPDWYANDGMVNTAFAKAPFEAKGTREYYDGIVPQRGTWINMPEIYVEHSGAVGFYLVLNKTVDMPRYYANHIRWIESLD